MSEPIRPRKPQVAVLMSLVLPGFGQLYNGEVNKAIWLYLIFSLLTVPGIALIAVHLPAAAMMPTLALATLTVLAVWGYAIVDAWRTARGLGQYRPPSWQVSGAYALVFLLCGALALPLLADFIRNRQVASFRIPSSSMEPGILPGDILFADRRYNCPDCAVSVARGDVAIFTYPNDRNTSYIKRVIALPGDEVRIAGHTVWVNGASLAVGETTSEGAVIVSERIGERDWTVRWNAATPAAERRISVPPGQAFVLGDNRSTSKDSRDFGTVPLQDIAGKARQIWLSVAPGGGVRWDRFGRVVR